MVPCCVTPVVKHGGVRMILRRSFAASRVCDLHKASGTLKHPHSVVLYAQVYTYSTTGSRFHPTARNKPPGYARTTGHQMMDGLSPTELVWDELDRRGKAKQHVWKLLQLCWEELSLHRNICLVTHDQFLIFRSVDC